MKVYAISLFHKTAKTASELSTAKDLTSFGYFQRASVGEFMTFFSKTLAERTDAGNRTSVEEKEYVCHVHSRQDGMVCIVIADKEYPVRVAFSLITRVVDEFETKYPAGTWTGNPSDTPFPQLNDLLVKYQKPEAADSLTKVQRDLDDTKVILRTTMEHVLERGEKMDDLVSKSENLSGASKMFYKTAKKANSCCTIS